MNLLIDGNLTYPPSEITCVRDVTLYTTVWTEYSVLIEITTEYKDHVWKHLKRFGAMDFVEDIVCVDEESGLIMSDRDRSNIQVNSITCENLDHIITCLRGFG